MARRGSAWGILSLKFPMGEWIKQSHSYRMCIRSPKEIQGLFHPIHNPPSSCLTPARISPVTTSTYGAVMDESPMMYWI